MINFNKTKRLAAKKVTIWMALLTIVFASFQQTAAYAFDTDFYSGNDILYYDPNATACTNSGATTTALIGNDNEEKIFNFLISKGLTAPQAAGFLGNIQGESSFNPNNTQAGIVPDGSMPIDGVGFGIVQWTHTDRQNPLVQMAKDTNRKTTDLELQLDYMWKELTDPSLAANNPWVNTVADVKKTTDPIAAATVVHYSYEISGAWPNFPPIRGTFAQTALAKYSGSTTTSTSTTPTTNILCGSGKGIGNYTSDQFTLYNQCDPLWGNIATPGNVACQVSCGPTSMAMIIKNMTGQNITPADTINYTTQINGWYPGGGTTMPTNVSIAEHWGLAASIVPPSVTINDVKDILNKNGLVILSGKGAAPFLDKLDSNGNPILHFVIIRGITSDGKFIVADPNGHSGNYDINTLMSGVGAAGQGGVAVFSK
jgi:hypothetical protein